MKEPVLHSIGTISPAQSGDVIFIHGLEGDHHSTWRNTDTDCEFPRLIAERFPNLAVWSLGYPISISKFFGKRTIPLEQCADVVFELFQQKKFGKRPFVAICHSYGGLLAQQIIRKASMNDHDLAENARGMAFFGTPQKGSILADILPWPGSAAIADLKVNSTATSLLRGWLPEWLRHNQVRILVFSEAPMLGCFYVVTPESAQGEFRYELNGKVDTLPTLDNHVTMCKPISKDSIVVGRVVRFITECLDGPRSQPPSGSNGSHKNKQINIGALLSGELPYTSGISTALKMRLKTLEQGLGVQFKYEPAFGPAAPLSANVRNVWKTCLEELKERLGQIDYYVAIGTLAAVVLKKMLGGEFGARPFIFLAVSEPVGARLVEDLQTRSDRRQVAGVKYDADVVELARGLRQLFPNKRLMFFYQRGIKADELAAAILNGHSGLVDDVRSLPKPPTIATLRSLDAIYFSGYTLESSLRNLSQDVEAYKFLTKRLVSTNSPSYVESGLAVAAIGCKDDEIALRGADLIVRHLRDGAHLGSLPIERPRFHVWINSRTAQERGLAYCTNTIPRDDLTDFGASGA